jgi:hypothetical protein
MASTTTTAAWRTFNEPDAPPDAVSLVATGSFNAWG